MMVLRVNVCDIDNTRHPRARENHYQLKTATTDQQQRNFSLVGIEMTYYVHIHTPIWEIGERLLKMWYSSIMLLHRFYFWWDDWSSNAAVVFAVLKLKYAVIAFWCLEIRL